MASMSSTQQTSSANASASSHRYRRSSVLSHKAPRKRTFIASMTKFLSTRDISLIPPSNDHIICCSPARPKKNTAAMAQLIGGDGNGNGPFGRNWGGRGDEGESESSIPDASATVLGALVIALSVSLAVETASRLYSGGRSITASRFVSQLPVA